MNLRAKNAIENEENANGLNQELETAQANAQDTVEVELDDVAPKKDAGMNKEGGFTLIELMITVAIIGILAAIAIPNVMAFSTRAKQSEAKTNIGHIRTLLETHYAEHDTFFTGDDGADPAQPTFNLLTLGYVKPAGARYNYMVSFPNHASYIITATTEAVLESNGGYPAQPAPNDGHGLDLDASHDTWTYTSSTGILECTVDDSVL